LAGHLNLGGDNWTMAGRRLSPQGITESEAAGPQKFCTTIAIVRKRQANHNSSNAIVVHVCHEQPAQKNQ
jgi:hypothetical protein